MKALAEYVSELAPMLGQLEAVVASGQTTGGAKLFEWRIRARIVDEKLQLAAKPAVPPDPERGQPALLAPQFAFGNRAAGNARAALPHVTALRRALDAGRVPAALEEARMISHFVIAGDID